MSERKTSEAQLRANKKWKEKNKEQMNYIRNRSAAKNFIKQSTRSDFEEIAQLANDNKLISSVEYDSKKIENLKNLVKDNINFESYSHQEKKNLFNQIQDIINYTTEKRKELFASPNYSEIVVTLDPVVESSIAEALSFQGTLLDSMLNG